MNLKITHLDKIVFLYIIGAFLTKEFNPWEWNIWVKIIFVTFLIAYIKEGIDKSR